MDEARDHLLQLCGFHDGQQEAVCPRSPLVGVVFSENLNGELNHKDFHSILCDVVQPRHRLKSRPQVITWFSPEKGVDTLLLNLLSPPISKIMFYSAVPCIFICFFNVCF